MKRELDQRGGVAIDLSEEHPTGLKVRKRLVMTMQFEVTGTTTTITVARG